MLPIAALPVAALLLRLGQPDLLGADGLGWDRVAAVIGAAGNALFANLALLFARRRRDRHGQEGRRLDRTRRGRRLPRLQGRRRRDLAVRARTCRPRATDAGADQLRRPRRHRHGPAAAFLWQKYHRIKLPPYLAFFGGRRFVPIITALRRDRDRGADGPGLPGVRLRPDRHRRVGHRELRHRRLRLRHAQPPADPARPAPHPELRPVVHHRRLRGVRRRDLPRRHRALPARRPDRGCVHDRLLPDHDVRAAGRRAGDLARVQAEAPEGRRRHHALRRADARS